MGDERQRIRFRRDTAAGWAATNPILQEGEPGYETDTKTTKIGDGVLNWVDLPAANLDVSTVEDWVVSADDIDPMLGGYSKLIGSFVATKGGFLQVTPPPYPVAPVAEVRYSVWSQPHDWDTYVGWEGQVGASTTKTHSTWTDQNDSTRRYSVVEGATYYLVVTIPGTNPAVVGSVIPTAPFWRSMSEYGAPAPASEDSPVVIRNGRIRPARSDSHLFPATIRASIHGVMPSDGGYADLMLRDGEPGVAEVTKVTISSGGSMRFTPGLYVGAYDMDEWDLRINTFGGGLAGVSIFSATVLDTPATPNRLSVWLSNNYATELIPPTPTNQRELDLQGVGGAGGYVIDEQVGTELALFPYYIHNPNGHLCAVRFTLWMIASRKR